MQIDGIDVTRESLGQVLRTVFPRIPDYMHDGLIGYVLERRLTGGFLTAVLENNLYEAVFRADGANQRAITDYAKFLRGYAPSKCYGSPAKVDAWLKGEGR